MSKAALLTYSKDNRGSALVSVFLVIVVILVLGAGILTLSAANAKQAVVDNTYERAYYVADGGAKQGVEAVKSAVLEQYRVIAAAVQSAGSADIGDNQASSFFPAVTSILGGFIYPQPDSSAGGPTSVTVNITDDGGSPTRTYTVTSKASGGEVSRTVTSSVKITFKQVKLSAAAFTPLGSETVLAGGTFDSTGGNVNLTGTARLGNLKYKQYNFNLNGNSNPSAADIQKLIDPTTASSLNWKMKYPGFTDAVKVPASQLSLPTFTTATEITNAAFSGPPYDWNVPSPIYLDLEGPAGSTFTISRFQYKGGQIFSANNLSIKNDVLGTAGSPVKIYCRGNLSLSNGAIKYVQIYCDGNLSISGGGGVDHVTIYCKGGISDSCTDRSNVRMYCKTYSMDGGNFNYNASKDTGNIVYAEDFIHIESTVHGFFYTNGNIDISAGGAGITGQIAAKGNITTTGYSFAPDSEMMAKLNADPFVSSSPAGGSAVAIQPLGSEIFTNTPSYKEQ